MRIKIILKQKQLLKSSAVRAWLSFVEKKIEKAMNNQEIRTALALGAPIKLMSNGTLKVVDIYKHPRGRAQKCLIAKR